jgi:hypothetical protein
VFGFQASRYSLVVYASGQSLLLTPGVPLRAATSSAIICAHRATTTGACITDSSLTTKQVAYFSFVLTGGSSSSTTKQSNVIISVSPTCNSSGMDAIGGTKIGCEQAGCDCMPLRIHVVSCAASRCTPASRKPSGFAGQYQATMTVAAAGSSMFLSSAAPATLVGNPDAFGDMCDPEVAGEACYYFAAVSFDRPSVTASSSVYYNYDTTSAYFSIVARSAGDLVLIPCDGALHPDGVKMLLPDTIDTVTGTAATAVHYFELCSESAAVAGSGSTTKNSELLVVEVEQCFGSTTLRACADSNSASACKTQLPTTDSWQYYGNSEQSCQLDNKRQQSCYDTTAPRLALPQHSGNYFVGAFGGGGFSLRVSETTHRGLSVAPQVVVEPSAVLAVPQVSPGGNSALIRFAAAKVQLQGLASSVIAQEMRYEVRVFEKTALEKALAQQKKAGGALVMNTLCGLDFATDTVRSIQRGDAEFSNKDVRTFSWPAGSMDAQLRAGGEASYLLTRLSVKTSYTAVVLAVCDASCLRQLSKSSVVVGGGTGAAWSTCGGAVDCQTQSFIFPAVSFTMSSRPDSSTSGGVDDDEASGSTGSFRRRHFVFVLVITIILLVLLALGCIFSRYNKSLKLISPHHSTSSSTSGTSGEVGVGIAMTELVSLGRSTLFGGSSGQSSSHDADFAPKLSAPRASSMAGFGPIDDDALDGAEAGNGMAARALSSLQWAVRSVAATTSNLIGGLDTSNGGRNRTGGNSSSSGSHKDVHFGEVYANSKHKDILHGDTSAYAAPLPTNGSSLSNSSSSSTGRSGIFSGQNPIRLAASRARGVVDSRGGYEPVRSAPPAADDDEQEITL